MMNRFARLLGIVGLVISGFAYPLSGQVGIGTASPDASAVLELQATDRGFLPPRMTASQRGMIVSPEPGLLVYQTDGEAGYYYFAGSQWTRLADGASPPEIHKDFRFTQPNGSGFESSANAWLRTGLFQFRGTSQEASPSGIFVIAYTTNASSWHRFRVFDATNATVIAISAPSNAGTNGVPVVVDLGPISNLPVNPAVFEIQMLSTDATGNTGISGRQAVGIHTFQLYE